MKTRTIITALMLALVSCAILVSCAPETVERSGDVAIGFSARTGDYTRSADATHKGGSTRGGTEIESAAELAAAGGFDAWTYSHTGSWPGTGMAIIVDNTGSGYAHVTSPDGGANWVYSNNPVYWPRNKYVTSFAVAPHGAGVTVTPPQTPDYTPTVTYTVPDFDDTQVDLMFAAAQYDLLPQDHGGFVPENFSHALSQVAFKAYKAPELEESVVSISLLEIVTNLHDTGISAIDSPADWEPIGQPTMTYEFTPPNLLNSSAIEATTSADAESLIPTNLGNIFVLPQYLGDDGGIELYVVYTIDGGVPITWTGFVDTPDEWLPGHRYTYTLQVMSDKIAIVCGQLTPPTNGGDWGNH